MGEVFAGRYELADPIGHGGVGAVWRAWDHRRRRYVAAKVLQQRDAHSLLRFVREQALRIDHPHVLAPASWAADDDKVLFTMDLVAGGSLVHLVGDYGPLPPAVVCTLLDQLLSGLAAVHAEGVVHRDIKPANILLEATGTGSPRLRLSDFGIAMRLGEPRLTETNLVVGTPGYLAPEQMLGAEPAFPADLFAAGLVALYLLEGARPDTKALVEYFAEHGTPGAPKGVPGPLWQVVSTLLQPDPTARFRTATGARKALASAVELLPEPGPDDELIEIFDQLGPLPAGFGPDGPFKKASGVDSRAGTALPPGPSGPAGAGAWSGAWTPAAGAAAPVGAGAWDAGAARAGGASGTRDVSSPANGPRAQDSVHVSGRPESGGTGSAADAPPDTPVSDAAAFDAFASGPSAHAPSAQDASASTSPYNAYNASPPGASAALDESPSGAPPGAPHSAPGAPHDAAGGPSRTASEPSGVASADPAAGGSAHAPQAAVPAGPGEDAGPRPSAMSDTGSFHLPPPRPARPPGTDTSGTPASQPYVPQPYQRPRQTERTEWPEPGPHQPLPGSQPHFPGEPTTAPTAPIPAAPATPPSGHVSAFRSAPGHAASLSAPHTETPWNPTQARTPAQSQRGDTTTAAYTARSPQVPLPAQQTSPSPAPAPSAVPGPRRAARHTRRARRPGPPAKVVVPVLLLALACYAVGFWALARS